MSIKVALKSKVEKPHLYVINMFTYKSFNYCKYPCCNQRNPFILGVTIVNVKMNKYCYEETDQVILNKFIFILVKSNSTLPTIQ